MWTDDRVAELKRLNERELSGSQIAARMGVTRNTVLGKLHRLGVVKTGGLPRKGANCAPYPHRARRIELPKAEPLPPLVSPPAATDEHGHHFTPEKIKHTGQCKFGFGDPANEDFYYCGNPAADVWCPFHQGVVLNKSPDQHRHHSPATIEKMRRAQRERRARAA